MLNNVMFTGYFRYHVSVAFMVLAPLFCGCEYSGSAVCDNTKIVDNLRSDFSYELLHDSNLPQIVYRNLNMTGRMNSIVWCNGYGEISGSGDKVLAALIEKYGYRKWKVQKNELLNDDFYNWNQRKIIKEKDLLALYLVEKYSGNIRNKDFSLTLNVNYNVDITGSFIKDVDYQEDIYIKFLSLVAADIPPVNTKDQYLISKILNTQTVK